ncbi:unnamed protein product [Paramecium primaurelia]|uniref:Uncharacterized protein n=1 Tax=Paramecium primaurelia TaxID=5886 RepID=A0A8S1M7G1_PARPR|nr:unnamed protein product [Paramecium primaurelia]
MNIQHKTKFESSQFERSQAKMRIVARVTRRRSIDSFYSQSSKTSKSKITLHLKDNLKRTRSYSNFISTYDQDSHIKEAYQTSKGGQDEFLKGQKKDSSQSRSSSHQSSMQLNQNNRKDDLNDIYEIRKDEVDFRKFNQNFQLDVLQLEALYYWLSVFGFQRSAPLQIPPYLSYYIYSLILYRSDYAKILTQYMDIYDRDNYHLWLKRQQSKYLKEKLQKQCISQIQFASDFEINHYYEFIIFSYLDSFIQKLNLDYKVLLDDFLKYFSLSNLQKDKIELSLKEDYIHRKNNIAFGNIRFVFKQKDGILVDFKLPIGKFEDQQFCDYVQFQTEFAKQLSQAESIQSFNQHRTEPHCERTLILFLLADIELNKSIFKSLNQDLINQQKIDKIDNLTKICLEITTENRVCSRCVSMFQYIPVEFICKKFKSTFGLNIDQKFQFIIISQYLLDPQIEQQVGKYQKIWIRTPQGQQIKQQQKQKKDFQTLSNQQVNSYSENFSENIQPTKQNENPLEQTDSQSIPKEDFLKENLQQQIEQEEIKEQELLVCYEEQEPTGLVSVLLLKERYCVGDCSNFKEKVDQIKITNTFFLSNEKQETPSQNSQSSKQEINIDSNSQSSRQKLYSNRLYLELIFYKEKFVNLLKDFSNIIEGKQFLVQNNFQKHQQTFKKQEDLLLETRSQFYTLLVKKFTSEFKQLNTQQFNLNTILSIYWEIGTLQGIKASHADLIDALKEELMLNSIIQCGNFNMALFLSDYTFLSKFITPQISKEIRKKNENFKILINFCQVQIFGQEESGNIKKIFTFNQAKDCNSLSQLIEQQINTVIKKFQNILITILSVDRIKQQCIERINNQILSFHHSNIELKYFSIKQKQRQHVQQFQSRQSQITEQEWDLLESEYYKQRYTLSKEGLFLSYKQLSENIDEELFSFECQLHSQNINM